MMKARRKGTSSQLCPPCALSHTSACSQYTLSIPTVILSVYFQSCSWHTLRHTLSHAPSILSEYSQSYSQYTLSRTFSFLPSSVAFLTSFRHLPFFLHLLSFLPSSSFLPSVIFLHLPSFVYLPSSSFLPSSFFLLSVPPFFLPSFILRSAGGEREEKGVERKEEGGGDLEAATGFPPWTIFLRTKNLAG